MFYKLGQIDALTKLGLSPYTLPASLGAAGAALGGATGAYLHPKDRLKGGLIGGGAGALYGAGLGHIGTSIFKKPSTSRSVDKSGKKLINLFKKLHPNDRKGILQEMKSQRDVLKATIKTQKKSKRPSQNLINFNKFLTQETEKGIKAFKKHIK